MDEADRECRVDEALRLLERALALVDGVNEDAAMHVQIAIDHLMPQPRQSQVAPDDWDRSACSRISPAASTACIAIMD